MPPTIVVGYMTRWYRTGGLTVIAAVFDPAVIVAGVLVRTGVVWTLTTAELIPSGTVIDAGTHATGFELLRIIFAPPRGAGAARVIFTVAGTPPLMAVG